MMTLLGVAVWVAAGRWSARSVRGLGLLVALLGAFYLYAVWAAVSASNAVVGIGLFLGSAVLFRLLSTFEQ